MTSAAAFTGHSVTAISYLADKDTGSNPYGIAALGVGVLVLVILLITFRHR